MRLRLLLVSALLITAGCLGTTDDEADTSGSDGGDAPSASVAFSSETYEGTVTGATTPGGSLNQGGGDSASFSIPNGTSVAYLNVTTEGGELDMQYGPDCQTDPTISCSNSASTSDGSLSIRLDRPEAGSWDAFFFIAQETAAGEVDWTLTVTTGIPTTPAN